MSKEKHFKIYDGEEPVKLIEFLNNGTINFANDEVKMIFEAGMKHVNNGVLDEVSFAKRKVCEGCGNKVYSAVGGCCRDCWEDGTATKQT